MMGHTSHGTRTLTAVEIGADAFHVFSTPFANHADSREVIWWSTTAGDVPFAVEPEHNSAVFFPSHLNHEVLPVTCRSKAFEDSRFAINVWIM
jgi:hypothetical protein